MFDNLLSQMQNQSEEIRKKMETVTVTGEAENGLVKVTANGNKKILNISISTEIAGDLETIEDLTIVAVNRAYAAAEALNEGEMKNMAQGMLPDLGSLMG